jgi:hypothetical protein
MKNIWTTLTSGIFWASGSVYYRFANGEYRLHHAEVKHASWQTATDYGNKNIVTSDDMKDYHFENHLRPSLRQVLKNYLGETEQTFMQEAYDRSYAKMLEYCESSFTGSIMLLAKPGCYVPMHRHRLRNEFNNNSTFTYVISSGTTKPNGAIVVMNENDEKIKMPYPDATEFCTLIDSSLMHGTEAYEGDDNYYMYFIFDGITLKNDTLKLNNILTC